MCSCKILYMRDIHISTCPESKGNNYVGYTKTHTKIQNPKPPQERNENKLTRAVSYEKLTTFLQKKLKELW